MWPAACPHWGDIVSCLEALPDRLDLQQLVAGLESPMLYRLRGLVLYRGEHYTLVVCGPAPPWTWVEFNDQWVSAVGSWQDVVGICLERLLRLHLALYEQT